MKINEAQVAVLAENQYQELELWYPLKADLAISEVEAGQLDALIIPGGFAPENFRRTPQIVNLVRKVHEQGSLVAAICHAGWLLASAGIAKGKRVTCVAIIKDDVINSGGNY